MMNGHPVMPVSGHSVSPSIARQAAVFGRQIQFGPRSLLDNLQPFYVPQPGSIISYDHEEAQRQFNNTTNQNTLSGTPENPRQPPPPLNLGQAKAQLIKQPTRDSKGRSKRRGRQQLKIGSMLR